MSFTLLKSIMSTSLLAQTSNDLPEPISRIFGLDAQLLVDTLIVMLAVFVLFLAASYLLFNPARELLRKRQERVQNDMDTAAKEKADGIKFKEEYDVKLKNADKEVDSILSEARKKGIKRENDIVDEAKAEAMRIIEHANKEVELEKSKVKDEVKQEMISVASLMAGKFVANSIDPKTQEQLIEDTLKEMGDDTWQS